MRRSLAVTYFAIQAAAFAGWWMALLWRKDLRPLFNLHVAPLVALTAFAPGDIVIASLGSAAVAFRRGEGWSRELAWVVTGAVLYATAYAITASAAGASNPIGAVLMALASAGSVASALRLRQS